MFLIQFFDFDFQNHVLFKPHEHLARQTVKVLCYVSSNSDHTTMALANLG